MVTSGSKAAEAFGYVKKCGEFETLKERQATKTRR
jgi:hypothetical protein